MIDLNESLSKTFSITPININERANIVESRFICKGKGLPGYGEVQAFFQQFPLRDSVTLFFNGAVDNITIYNTTKPDDYEKFLSEINTDEDVEIKLSINKFIRDNKISVYNFYSFSNWILGKSIIEQLKIFDSFLKNKNYLIFELFDSKVLFSTKTMIFTNSENQVTEISFDRLQRLNTCEHNTNFYNFKDYELIPDDFNIVTSFADNGFADAFLSLETILSIVYLSNTSNINDNTINLQIAGYRDCTFSYPLTSNNIIKNKELCTIYRWIYTEGNPIDKAIIARNIISLHCKYTDLVYTDEKTFASIKSNYSLYQKNNVAQYIELKNKLGEFIIGLASQTEDALLGVSNGMKHNLVALITLFFTVFIANIFTTSPLENIFSYDITLLTYLFILGSIGFLIISTIGVNYKIKKIRRNYGLLKDNYKDILDKKDILDIFNNVVIVNGALEETKKRRNAVLIIWSILILGLLVVVELLSDTSLIF